MAMRLGTVAPVGFPQFDPKRWLGSFRRLGCQVVQVYRNPAANVSADDVRAAVRAGGMPCDSIHGVFGEGLDPSALDDEARARSVRTYTAEGELAAELCGPLVVVHCSTIRPAGVGPAERTRRWDQLRRSVEQLSAVGQRLGVTYAFENLPGYHAIGSDVAELGGFLRDLAAPNVGMCLDTGHAHMTGDAAEAVRSADGQMVYLHLSDNSGRADDHDMPTVGTLDLPAVASALRQTGYDGTIMLETFYDADRLDRLIEEGLGEMLRQFLDQARAAR